jgi:hypothetical protein
VSFVVLCIAWTAAIAQGDDQSRELRGYSVPYPSDGAELGDGWNSALGIPTQGNCIEFKPEGPSDQVWDSSAKRVLDDYELNQSLAVSSELQLKAILGGDISAKVKFARDSHVHTSTLMVAVHGTVANAPKFVHPIEGQAAIHLKKEAQDWLDGDPEKFRLLCGDSYVAVVFEGAELLGLIESDLRSWDERESLSTSLHAGIAGSSISTDAERALKQAASHSRLTIHITGEGGLGEKIQTDEAGLNAALKNLGEVAAKHPHRYSLVVRSYRTISTDRKLAELFNKDPATARDIDLLVEHYQKYRTLFNDMQDVDAHWQLYAWTREWEVNVAKPAVSRQVFATKVDLARSRLTQLGDQLQKCRAGGSCAIPDEAMAPDYDVRVFMPVLLHSITLYDAPKGLAESYNNMHAGLLPVSDFQALSLNYADAMAEEMYRQAVAVRSVAACNSTYRTKYCLEEGPKATYRRDIYRRVTGHDPP